MNNICFSCKEPCVLTSEHIIPQALGGRFQEKLYCKPCNDKFGEIIDSELTIQFGRFATILRIKRERGTTQPFEVMDVDRNIPLLFDGVTLKRKDPIVKIEHEPDGKTLKSADITARSEYELKKICGSIDKRYKLNREIKTFQDIHTGPTGAEHELTIDNKLIRRSVTKIAYSLLCTKIPENIIFSTAFEEVRAYIKDGAGRDLAHANFVHTQFMTDYTRPLHKIHISLNRSEKIVVGYVSLFGIFRFTVLLSENFASPFEWPGLDYTFDPVRRKEVFGNPKFRPPTLNKDEILQPKQSKKFVQTELNRGQQVIETYIEGFKFVGGEFS